MKVCIFQLLGLIGPFLALVNGAHAGGGASELDARFIDANGTIELSWVLESVNHDAPYHFPSVQVQLSSNLNEWECYGEPMDTVSGSESELEQSVVLNLETVEPTLYFRLACQLRGGGGDFSGVNFSGSNLSSADFSGSDLAGASFAGADLTGAYLIGATLTNTNFDDADLSGAQFDASTRTPYQLRKLGGDPGACLELGFPDLPYYAEEEDFVTGLAGFEGIAASAVTLVVSLAPAATIGEVNALLAAYDGSIAGSIGASVKIAQPIVAIRIGPGNSLADTRAAFEASPAVQSAALDMAHTERSLPDYSAAGGTANWTWENPTSGDGNWGHEYARVPQMWNLNSGIDRLARKRGNTEEMFPVAVVVDSGFDTGHPELAKATLIPGNTNTPADHGTHVAGIFAADHEGGGMEGVDPHTNLHLMPYSRPFSYISQLKDIAWLAIHYGPRVINCSYGYSWVDRATSTVIQPSARPAVQEEMETWSLWARGMFAGLRSVGRAPFVVIAAGNDAVDAEWAGALERYARVIGTDDIFIVGSQALAATGARAASNTNYEILAPGSSILSSISGGIYGAMNGTSQAAPYVAGVASYMLHLNPNLSNGDLKNLLSKGAPVGVPSTGVAQGTPGTLDAFHSALLMDTVAQPSEAPVLQLLLDIDDGTPDGSLRLDMPGIEEPNVGLTQDRSFAAPAGLLFSDFDHDEDGGIGNWVIDMADFRRWRDWYLMGDATNKPIGLNAQSSKKLDGNLDGTVGGAAENATFSRGDWNGDGKVDLTSTAELPGLLENEGPLSDLDVLIKSGFWADEDEYAVNDLPGLVDSVDFVVSARGLLETKHPELAEGVVGIYEDGTDQIEDIAKPKTLTPDEPTHIFTVPTGKKYYVASEPITMQDDDGDEVKVIMRSIGEVDAPEANRGADYIVDLTKVEMTAKASAGDDIKLVDSRPNEEEVETQIEALNGIETQFGVKYAGSHAMANEKGTFHALARTGVTDGAGFNPGGMVEFKSHVTWQRSFPKDPIAPFKFKVKPLDLRLVDGRVDFEDMFAFAEIRVERRYYGTSGEWETVYYAMTEISGYSEGLGGGHTFEISQHEHRDHEGELPKSELELLIGEFVVGADPDTGQIWTVPFTLGATYHQDEHDGEIPTDDIAEGDTFDVRYTLNARAISSPADEYAEASIGDPIDYGSGITIEYGGIGELFSISDVTFPGEDNGSSTVISHRSDPDFYYVLERVIDGEPVAIALGVEGIGQLVDPSPPAGANETSYILHAILIDQPRDTDEDGIDDITELDLPEVFDPLDPNDAELDYDGDGFTNLAEHERGSDPRVFDESDADPNDELLFPGRLVEIEGSQSVHTDDFNNDGLLDFISLSGSWDAKILTTLANPDSTFRIPLVTPIPGSGSIIDMSIAHIDGDSILDAVVLDGLDNEVTIFLGNGEGTFAESVTYGTGDTPNRLTLADATGDGSIDILVVLERSREILILANNGPGSFDETSRISFGYRPLDVAVGFFDSDELPDLAVSLVSHQVAMVAGIDPGFSSPDIYPVGFSPERLATGDLDGDGFDEVFTSNKSSNDISLLKAIGNGSFGAEIRYPVGKLPSGIVVRDGDGDGHLDVLVSHYESSYTSFLRGDGAGGLGQSEPIFTTPGNDDVLLGDWNDDSILDLAGVTQNRVLILQGTGNGEFETRTQLGLSDASIIAVEFADMDGDGEMEVVVLDSRQSTIDVWEHGLTNEGDQDRLSTLIVSSQPVALTVMDFNGDGNLDAVIACEEPQFFGEGANKLTLLAGNGHGSFDQAGEIALDQRPGRVIAAELSGDTFVDLVVVMPDDDFNTSAQEARIIPMLNDGAGDFHALTPIVPKHATSRVLARDIDGDQQAEIFIATGDFSSTSLYVYKREGSGEFFEAQSIVLNANPSLLQWADADADDSEDLVTMATSGLTGEITVEYCSVANGQLTSPSIWTSFDAFGSSVAIADVAGDEQLDFLIGGAALMIASSDASAPFEQRDVYTGGSTARLLDLNDDGKLDIAAWNSFGSSIELVLQRP